MKEIMEALKKSIDLNEYYLVYLVILSQGLCQTE